MPFKAEQSDIQQSVGDFAKQGARPESDPLLEKEQRLNQTGQAAPGRPEVSPDRVPKKVKRADVPKEVIPLLIKKDDYICLHPYTYKYFKKTLRAAIYEFSETTLGRLRKINPVVKREIAAYREAERKELRKRMQNMGINPQTLHKNIHGFESEPFKGRVEKEEIIR